MTTTEEAIAHYFAHVLGLQHDRGKWWDGEDNDFDTTGVMAVAYLTYTSETVAQAVDMLRANPDRLRAAATIGMMTGDSSIVAEYLDMEAP